MHLAYQTRRGVIANKINNLLGLGGISEAMTAALNEWLDGKDDAALSEQATDKILALIGDEKKRANGVSLELLNDIEARKDCLIKKSVWIVGGDGWAYDIGYNGVDHVLASGEDVNILVLDTEVYSNTGGQVSKATPLGAVMKYAADGKRTIKKDLGRMMMTYGNIYVASVALGANYVQTIKALMEAEAYPGPSIVIAYCPCINHGIRSGMSHAAVEQKLAVKAGYWPLYRNNPALTAQGKPALTVDCAAPDGSLITFINGENRYADLRMVDPREAAILQPELQKHLDEVYSIIVKQQ